VPHDTPKPAVSGGPSVKKTAAHPSDAYYTRRDTVGWTGTPTSKPPKGSEHLGVIHRGQRVMPPAIKTAVDAELRAMEEVVLPLRAEDRRLAKREQELHQEHAKLLATPDARLRPHQRDLKAKVQAELDASVQRRGVIHAEVKAAKRKAVKAMMPLYESLRTMAPADAMKKASRIRATDDAKRVTGETRLKMLVAEFYRFGSPPLGVKRFTFTDARADANRNGDLNVGSDPTKTKMFHEMGHYLEYSQPEIAAAARAWVRARSEQANGGNAKTTTMRELSGSDEYRADEVAYEDHFDNPYVGKRYDDRHTTEVVSVGMESFISPDKMVDLYQRDPEHFFFMLGVLKR
jgi:hypothetical protein